MTGRFLITGCSGGGKSTLLDALAQRGYATVPEPGRRIVAEAGPMPWEDPAGFARRAVDMARADLARTHTIPTFFDRGLIDAAVALAHAGGPSLDQTLGSTRHYETRVFVAPPWPEIFRQDPARRHDFSSATEEHDRLMHALAFLGYNPLLLPRAPVADRVALVMAHLTRT